MTDDAKSGIQEAALRKLAKRYGLPYPPRELSEDRPKELRDLLGEESPINAAQQDDSPSPWRSAMTDEEYREFLSALARRHVSTRRWREHFGPMGADEHLGHEIDRLASTARFVKAVSDRADEQELLDVLAKELRNTYLGRVTQAMEQSGVLDALDEVPDITFPNLRRSAIPDEDAELLRHAGIDDPEAMMTIIIHYSRKHVGGPNTRPSQIAERAHDGLRQAADMLSAGETESLQKQPEKKKRKILNGVGKILAGAITGAGNLLLFTGTIVAPNPATAYGVIGSSALAVGSICQGLGDLRGEG